MKKTIRWLLLAFMLTLVFCVSVAAAEQTGAQLSYVTDSAELLSENENMRLEKMAEAATANPAAVPVEAENSDLKGTVGKRGHLIYIKTREEALQ